MAGKTGNKKASVNTASTRRGASNLSVTFREKSGRYFQNHRFVAKDSVQRLWIHPIASLMTLAVIAIALALPSGFYLLLKNVQVVAQNWDGRAQISLFLSDKVSEKQGMALGNSLKKHEDIEKTEFISKEQALKEFEDVSGLKNVMGGLSENPLPSVIVVYPKSTEPGFLDNLQSQLARKPGVDLAQLDSEWVQRLHSILKLGQRIVGALSIGLVLAVLLVVVNTIGLAIENRKEEIIVTKLIGATDSFVRRPFLYTGIWYGFGGGMLALIIINGFLIWLNSPVNELAILYGAHFSLSGLGFVNSTGLLFFAALLGLLGAWAAVGRHLREIEPQ